MDGAEAVCCLCHALTNLLIHGGAADNTTLAKQFTRLTTSYFMMFWKEEVAHSVSFFANETWLEKYSRNGNVRHR